MGDSVRPTAERLREMRVAVGMIEDFRESVTLDPMQVARDTLQLLDEIDRLRALEAAVRKRRDEAQRWLDANAVPPAPKVHTLCVTEEVIAALDACGEI